jgi:hypothetical protein
MRPDTQHTIAERARQQLGLVTRSRLRDLSVSDDALRLLVANHRLQRLTNDVLRIAGAPPSCEQLVLAACLDTGGVASHRTAARLHRLHGFHHASTVEVTVPRRRHHGRNPLAVVHTSTNLPPDDRVHVGTIPATGVARTLLGLAALVPQVPVEVVRTALGVAARDGVVSDPWLELLDAAGIVLPAVQRRIRVRGNFVARVDTIYEERRVIIELDGHASHSTRQQIDADERRRTRLTLAGYTVIVFTYDHVVADPAYVIDSVREARRSTAAA